MKLDRDRLIRLRRHCQWSQFEAAEAADVSTQAYSRAECGYGIRRTTAYAIIAAFREKLEELESSRQDLEAALRDDLAGLVVDERKPKNTTVSMVTLDAVADPF